MLVVQDLKRVLEVESVTGSMALALMSPWLKFEVNGFEHETPEAERVEAANFFGQGSAAAGFSDGDSLSLQHHHSCSKV